MASLVTVGGMQYKKRNPIGVWLLSLVTLGIYAFVWYFKINDEARRYLGDDKIKPGRCVLAFIPGALLVYIPPIVSLYNSGTRVQRMQQKAGVQGQISAVLTVLGLFFFALWLPYLQSNLNKVWDAAAPSA